jgi:hypothetical protein
MAISNDWYIDYTNKVICHATHVITYDGELNGGFTAGQLIGNTSATPTKTAIVVKVTDNGTDGTLDVVYVVGSWANNDELYVVGGTKRGDVNGAIATKTTTYTTRALYSFVQDTFDELGNMDDTVPMSAQTPTEFTLINGWFIDDESVKFLTGGALQTSGYDTVIQIITFQSGGYTSAINSDIGKMVNDDAVDSGNLLHFNNTTRKWWVRWGTTIASGSAITLDSSGTGAGTTNSTGDYNGEDLYANVYTLGSIAVNPNPQTYIFQNSVSITPWWGRGDSFAAIDVLIKVKESGSEIDGANITVYVRHFGDLYDHFGIDLTSGGRNAVPLSSATDLNNNTTGEAYLLYDGQSGTFTEGLILTGGTSGATAEIIDDTDNGTTGVLLLGNIKGTFADNETITDTSTGVAVANGTVGDTLLTYDAQSANFTTIPQILTSDGNGAQRQLVGQQDNGTSGLLVAKVSAVTDADHFKTFADNAVVSGASEGSVTLSAASVTATAGYADIKVWFVNGTITHGGITGGPYVEGETITGGTSTATGVMLLDSAGTMTLGNVVGTFQNTETLTGGTSGATSTSSSTLTSTHTMSKAFTQGSPFPYAVIVNCASRTMAKVYEWLKYVTRDGANSSQVLRQIMYPVISATVVQQDGEEYIAARVSPDTAYTPVKVSPFGSFAGGRFFGAQGVWVQNMASTDVQSFQLIDGNGVTRTPPNFQSLTITGIVSGDKVTVFRTTSGTTINKAVFTAAAGNSAGNSTFVVNEAIPTDTPTTGTIRIVDTSDTSINRETRYTYTSWATSTFSGISPVLDRTYTTTDDTAYVPYIDTTASGTSATVSVIYTTDRSVLARVRRYNGAGDSILPFETTGTFGSTGYSTAAIRTTDSIVT